MTSFPTGPRLVTPSAAVAIAGGSAASDVSYPRKRNNSTDSLTSTENIVFGSLASAANEGTW